MDENLVGYLLDALDAPSRQEVENYLHDNPEAQKRIDLLREALRPLEADRDAIDPPPNLKLGTLSRVAQYCSRRTETEVAIPKEEEVEARSHSPLLEETSNGEWQEEEISSEKEGVPAAPPILERGSAPSFSWWRRADVLVAASLLFALLGFGLPALYRLRSTTPIAECENNLRAIHQALMSYSDQHEGRFPQVEETRRRNIAGIFRPILQDAGFLDSHTRLRCPASAVSSQLVQCSLKELDQMSEENFNAHASLLGGCYAYSLGYRDASGRLYGLCKKDDEGLPLLADRPCTDAESACNGRGNSPNHNGWQNVLYRGGHVRFVNSPEVGLNNDHIYLNRSGKVAAGECLEDTVLGASADKP